jgi:hypothetical protein
MLFKLLHEKFTFFPANYSARLHFDGNLVAQDQAAGIFKGAGDNLWSGGADGGFGVSDGGIPVGMSSSA